LPAVDASIAAAWIGAGVGGGIALIGVVGTVMTSIVNSNNTRKATERTVEAGTAANRATLIAAREDALWAARASAYEETLAGLLYRQSERLNVVVGLKRDQGFEQQLKEAFGRQETPAWFKTQGRLVAYGSNIVIGAFNAATEAYEKVRERHAHVQGTREQRGSSGETMAEAERMLNSAILAARAADDALIRVIRDELRRMPTAARLRFE
jgi:hypothetical protein